MHRLFVAIRPPEDIRDILVDTMDEGPTLNWVSDDNLHLTLRFVGQIDRRLANDLTGSLARIRFEPFSIRLHGIGKFERRNGGALWAGIEPKKPVVELAGKVERACQLAGLEPERRAFHPHITLARWNRGTAGAVESFVRRNSDLASEPFDVDSFTLFESHLSRHGAHYAELADYPRAD
jgi:2'-5' RNA ligase